jgi:hypothetical protein
MGLSRKVDNKGRRVLMEHLVDISSVSDVTPKESESRMSSHIIKTTEAAGVGQFIKHNDSRFCPCQYQSHEITAYESGSTSYN